MPEQLKFSGDPVFEPTMMERLFQQMMEETIRDVRRSMNRVSFGFDPNWQAPFTVQQLFVRLPQCHHSLDLGEDVLDCDLDDGHRGSHYDAHLHVDWSSR